MKRRARSISLYSNVEAYGQCASIFDRRSCAVIRTPKALGKGQSSGVIWCLLGQLFSAPFWFWSAIIWRILAETGFVAPAVESKSLAYNITKELRAGVAKLISDKRRITFDAKVSPRRGDAVSLLEEDPCVRNLNGQSDFGYGTLADDYSRSSSLPRPLSGPPWQDRFNAFVCVQCRAESCDIIVHDGQLWHSGAHNVLANGMKRIELGAVKACSCGFDCAAARLIRKYRHVNATHVMPPFRTTRRSVRAFSSFRSAQEFNFCQSGIHKYANNPQTHI